MLQNILYKTQKSKHETPVKFYMLRILRYQNLELMDLPKRINKHEAL
jgi:hypothetical protein